MTLETTPASATANSYVSLDEATTYFSRKPTFSAIWNALTTSQQEARLIEATLALDRAFTLRGRRAHSTQALQFPRIVPELQARAYSSTPWEARALGLDSDSEDYTPSTQIPERIKHAQLELLWLLEVRRDPTSGSLQGGQNVRSLSLGGVNLGLETRSDQPTLEALGGGSVQTLLALLRPWLPDRNRLELLM